MTLSMGSAKPKAGAELVVNAQGNCDHAPDWGKGFPKGAEGKWKSR